MNNKNTVFISRRVSVYFWIDCNTLVYPTCVSQSTVFNGKCERKISKDFSKQITNKKDLLFDILC